MILRGLIITILILSYNSLLFSQNKKVIDQIVAVVGKNVILQSDIENQYLQMKSQGYYSGSDLKCEILEDMLFRELLINQAELDSIEITPREVSYAIDNRFRQIVAQIGSEEKLEEYFGKSILEMKEDLKYDMKDQLLSQKMQNSITNEIEVTPSEVRNYYNNLNEDSIPFIDDSYELQQITIKPEVSNDEILKVKEQLREYKKRIENGDKFSTLAVLYSDDPGTSSKGGELGFVTRTELDPDFASVAFSLKDKNKVSKIVKSQFGYHIVQLIEKKGELVNVRHILKIPRISTKQKIVVKQHLDSIRRLIKQDSISFASAAEKFSEDEMTKNNAGLLYNQMKETRKFENDELDPATQYAIKNAEVGDITKPFKTQDQSGETYKILKIKSKIKSHKANLRDDYKRLKEMALAEKKQKTLNNWLKNKINSTYVHIDDSYKNCSFNSKEWNKL